MRSLVALVPPADVLERLEQIERPDDGSVRWTNREQWHVTLRFLGEIGSADLPALVDALDEVGTTCSRQAVRLGPTTARLGPGVLVVPVHGAERLAAVVQDATAGFGQSTDPRSFTGHVTIGRGRGRRPVSRSLEGLPVEAGWIAEELVLVRSHRGDAPARYEALARARLQPPAS